MLAHKREKATYAAQPDETVVFNNAALKLRCFQAGQCLRVELRETAKTEVVLIPFIAGQCLRGTSVG